MKKLTFLFLFAGAVATTFTACKKDSTTTSDDLTSTVGTQADDHARFDNEMDAVSNEADAAVEAAPIMAGGRVDETDQVPCDATVAYDTVGTNRQITITYNGTNCNGTRTRTGVVTVSMPLGTHWNDAGAVLTVNVQNLHVTRLSDNKSITINGIKTITNVTGGLLNHLATFGTIKHVVSGSDLSVTFDDNTTRTWSVNKQREFTYDNGVKISVTGLHSDNGTDGIAEWGTARNGSPFETVILEPRVIRQDCDWRIVSGKELHKKLQREVTVTYGLDATGNPTDCPGSGHFYLKAEWTSQNGTAHSVLKPY